MGSATERKASSAGMPAIWLWGSCPSGHARQAAHPSPEHRTRHGRSSFPPGWAGVRPPGRPGELPTFHTGQGNSQHHGEWKGDRASLSALGEERTSVPPSRKAAKPPGSRLIPSTRNPRVGRPRGQSLPGSNIPLHPADLGRPNSPTPAGYHCMGPPTQGTAARRCPCHPSAPSRHQPHSSHPQPPGPGDSHVGSPSAAQRQLSLLCGNLQLSAQQGQRDFTGTSPAGRPPSPRRSRFLSQ